MDKLVTMLDEWLVKKAPFQLPENGKKGLVTALPWIALVLGILELFAAWGLWTLATFTSRITDAVNQLSAYGYTSPVSATVGPVIWLSLIIVLAEAVMFLVAFAGLKAHKKSGWTMMFWISLLNIVYAVVYLFVNQSIFSLLMSLVGSVIGLYLLFQVRSFYGAGDAKPVVKK